VVVLGRIVAHKRVDLVVRAVAVARRARPGLTLDVIGTGDEIERVRETVHETRLDGVVTLHGFLADADKSRVLSNAALHVCASDAEGWGQVVLEAAAHGVPTLARDVPGLRDSIRDGKTGWLIPPASSSTDDDLVARLAEGIGSGLDRMSEPEVRDRIADDCREWASGFGWEQMRAEARDAVTAALDERR
jgi:glycosyltransferase involved in cell wall biosynthesis